MYEIIFFFFFFQAEDGIRDTSVTGVQTCALPICPPGGEGEKMEYARRAALAVLDQLGPHDLAGAIAFDSQPYELGPLLPVSDGRPALAARIRALRHGGGTDFKEALDMARRDLVA